MIFSGFFWCRTRPHQDFWSLLIVLGFQISPEVLGERPNSEAILLAGRRWETARDCPAGPKTRVYDISSRGANGFGMEHP